MKSPTLARLPTGIRVTAVLVASVMLVFGLLLLALFWA
jgi:hypothetical protein